VVFHIQTEDSGLKTPHVFTHLFHGGVIVSTKKLVYDAGTVEEGIKALMQSQHKSVMKELKKGTFDAKIDEYLSDTPGLLPSTAGDKAARAVTISEDTGPIALIEPAALQTGSMPALAPPMPPVAPNIRIRSTPDQVTPAATAATAIPSVPRQPTPATQQVPAPTVSSSDFDVAEIHSPAIPSVDPPGTRVPTPAQPPAIPPGIYSQVRRRQSSQLTPIVANPLSASDKSKPVVPTSSPLPPAAPVAAPRPAGPPFAAQDPNRRPRTPTPSRVMSSNQPPRRRASTGAGVVMSRPAVIVGGPKSVPTFQTQARIRNAREGDARPGNTPISEKSLDDVILAYLSEDAKGE
jgi:hypothetical protein